MGRVKRSTQRIEAGKRFVHRVLAWWKASRPGRMLARYSAARGGLLAGGIAYSALFSLFAALTIGYTLVAAFIGSARLQQAVTSALSSWLPGVVDDGSGNGLIDPADLVRTDLLTWTGIVAAVVLLVSATSFVASLRNSIRAMFAIADTSGAVRGKLTEVAGFALLCLAVFASAALGVALAGFSGWVAELLGLQAGAFSDLVAIVGALVVWAVDAGVVALCFVFLAGARPPGRDLAIGSIVAAAVLGLLRTLGTSVIAGGHDNPLLASFTTLVTVLVWVNLISRVVLMAAAWTANPPAVDTSAPAPGLDAQSQA